MVLKVEVTIDVDTNRMVLRATTPRGYFSMGALTAACIKAGCPVDEITSMLSQDQKEMTTSYPLAAVLAAAMGERMAE